MDMLRFAMKDVMFNLVVENIFTAPFQRFQTSQAVIGKDAQCTPMDVATIHNEAQVEGKPLIEDPPCQGDGGGEDRYNGRLVPGANVLGLVAAAAALGAAAAFKKEEGKLVVEVGGWGAGLEVFDTCCQICSSLAALISVLLETVLRFFSPPGLMSLVATQVMTMIERLQTKFSPLKDGNLIKVITLKAPADALGQLGWFVLTMVAGNLVLPLLLLPLILLSVVR